MLALLFLAANYTEAFLSDLVAEVNALKQFRLQVEDALADVARRPGANGARV